MRCAGGHWTDERWQFQYNLEFYVLLLECVIRMKLWVYLYCQLLVKAVYVDALGLCHHCASRLIRLIFGLNVGYYHTMHICITVIRQPIHAGTYTTSKQSPSKGHSENLVVQDRRMQQTSALTTLLYAKIVLSKKAKYQNSRLNSAGVDTTAAGVDTVTYNIKFGARNSYGAGGWRRCPSDRNLICMQEVEWSAGTGRMSPATDGPKRGDLISNVPKSPKSSRSPNRSSASGQARVMGKEPPTPH